MLCTTHVYVYILAGWLAGSIVSVKYSRNCFAYNGDENDFNTLNDSFHNNYLIRIRNEFEMFC